MLRGKEQSSKGSDITGSLSLSCGRAGGHLAEQVIGAAERGRSRQQHRARRSLDGGCGRFGDARVGWSVCRAQCVALVNYDHLLGEAWKSAEAGLCRV